MMLLLLSVLLSVVYSVTGDCQATDVQTENPSHLPGLVKQQLEEAPDSIDLSNVVGMAVSFRGFPETLNPNSQFTAVCTFSAELSENPSCRNLTFIDGQFGKSPMTKDDFLDFYRHCSNDPNFNFNQ